MDDNRTADREATTENVEKTATNGEDKGGGKGKTSGEEAESSFYLLSVEESSRLANIEGLGDVQHVQLEDGSRAVLLDEAQLALVQKEEAEKQQSSSSAVKVPAPLETSGEKKNAKTMSLTAEEMKQLEIEPGMTVLAENQDGTYEVVRVVTGDGSAADEAVSSLAVVSVATANSSNKSAKTVEQDCVPQGLKSRRNRVYGSCKCSECGQAFVNTARLERHLAVHQIFGSYLCPLCGKTYKYEYNLFYHWRRTCRDLNELMPVEERRTLDVVRLRQLVDEVAAKKAEMGAFDAAFRRNSTQNFGRFFRDMTPPQRSQVPPARRGEACHECGVVVMGAHLSRHMAIHKGDEPVDGRSVSGGYYCDLCGLMFRAHFNLMKHWRTSCPEIQIQINPDVELTMDDEQLRQMVEDLLRKKKEEPSERATAGEQANIEQENSQQNESVKEGLFNERGEIRVPEMGSLHEKQDASLGPDGSGEKGVSARVGQEEQTFGNDFVRKGLSDLMPDEGVDDPELQQLANTRAKWSMMGGPVQCPECFRSFANAGRLERHLAGFHASFGVHSCILCGNRFKYDYNLLYHYRRSCPYTKAFLDRDVREQMDAQTLRKLVRTLSHKDVRIAPQLQQPVRLPGQSYQIPRPRVASTRVVPTQPDMATTTRRLARANLAGGTGCPVCSVVFYGKKTIDRHLEAAHPKEFARWDSEKQVLKRPEHGPAKSVQSDVPSTSFDETLGEKQQALPRERQVEEEEEQEEPPTLLPNEPTTAQAMDVDLSRPRASAATAIDCDTQVTLSDVEEEDVEMEDDEDMVMAVMMMDDQQQEESRQNVIVAEEEEHEQNLIRTPRLRLLHTDHRRPATIDPTLESSVATFLSEMKEEASRVEAVDCGKKWGVPNPPASTMPKPPPLRRSARKEKPAGPKRYDEFVYY